jgi:hypothetical protein
MGSFYKYAIVRLAPDDSRDERINIGIAVFTSANLDLRLTKKLEKIRAISSAINVGTLSTLAESLKQLDDYNRSHGGDSIDARAKNLQRVGALSLSSLGSFKADNGDEYETRITSIMRSLIEPEPSLPRVWEKRSRLLTHLKRSFRSERVLARQDEDLSSHRIVSNYQFDEGLVADLVLQNGSYHVVETVDATGRNESVRRAIGDIGIAALVLERARMKFGDDKTKAKLVFNASSALENAARPSLDAAAHQGAELFNWASVEDRSRLLRSLSSLATPFVKSSQREIIADGAQASFLN